MRSRSRRGSKRSRPNSVQSEDVLSNKVAPHSRHSSAPPPGSKTENFSTPNINEDSTLELDSAPMVKSKSLGLKTPLDTITQKAVRKTPNNSDNASTEGDEDRSSSPLTERSSNSDFTMGPVAEYTPTTTNTKPGARTYEDLPESNPQTLGTTPDRASAPASITGPTTNGQLSDSSSLSELEDSEAETERLDLSPHKNTFQNPLHNAAGKLTSGRNFSMLSEKPTALNFDDDQLNHLRANLEDMTEELTPEGSIRGASVGPEQKKRKVDDMEARDEDESFQGTPKSTAKSTKDGDEDVTMKDETNLTDDEVQDDGSPPSKEGDDIVTPSRVQLSNGNPSKSQLKTPIDQHRSMKEVVDDSSNEEVDDINESPSKDTENGDVEASGETELDNETAREEEEEILRIKKAAAEEMKNIETLFAQLRDKLVEERVSDIDREIAMINDGTHPELILMARSVEERRDQKTHAADVLLKHQREAQERHIIATKAAIHSQYYQEVRQLREDALSRVNTMWFAIHRERRAADTNVNDFVFKIPKQISTQYKHRAAYNKEVSLLSGIAKYVGFPAAPEIQGASLDDTRADLEAMGLAAHSQLPFPSRVLNPLHPHMQTYATSSQPSAFAGPSQPASSSQKQAAISYYNQKAMLESSIPLEVASHQTRPRSPISPLIAPKPIAVPQQPAREFAYSAQQSSPPDAAKHSDHISKADYRSTPPQSSKSHHSRQPFVHAQQSSTKHSLAQPTSTYDTSLDSIFGLGNHNGRGSSLHDRKSASSHSTTTFRPASPGWDPMSNGSYIQNDLYDSLDKEKSNAQSNVHAPETHLKDEIRAGGSRYY